MTVIKLKNYEGPVYILENVRQYSNIAIYAYSGEFFQSRIEIVWTLCENLRDILEENADNCEHDLTIIIDCNSYMLSLLNQFLHSGELHVQSNYEQTQNVILNFRIITCNHKVANEKIAFTLKT